MQYWLFKSEPFAYSFEQLRTDGTTSWSGVRNYQARNSMMAMRLGDRGLFYHSSIPQPCAVGICEVVRIAHPDTTAFDPKSEYYDRRSTPEKPLWMMVDVAFVKPLKHPVTLEEMRGDPRLVGMTLLKKGSRLSVQPVAPHEWEIVMELARSATKTVRD